DAADFEERVEGARPAASHVAEGGVAEDHVRRYAMFVGQRRAKLAQFFEQTAIDPFPVVGRLAAARFAIATGGGGLRELRRPLPFEQCSSRFGKFERAVLARLTEVSLADELLDPFAD